MDEKFENIRKYNLWDGKPVAAGFPRKTYTNHIEKYIGNRLIKVIVGQRRAGKSYLMRQLANNLLAKGIKPQNILIINKEFEAFDFLSTHEDLNALIRTYLKEFNPQGPLYIFIDEVQDIEGWEQVVNSYSQDYTGKYELFVTGSNSKMLSGELSTLLSGRYVEFQVFPLSFTEFCTANQLENNRQNYIKYVQSGGLPELLNLHGEEIKRHYVSALKDTVLLKDIILRHNIKEVRFLEDLFIFLVNNASNIISIPNIINYFKSRGRRISYDTVANYIGYIGEAYLIHKAERYNIRGKEVISGNCKFYVNDLAFKNYLYKGFGYGTGYLLENTVYLVLLHSGYEVYVGNIKDKEVDFVALKDDDTLYVQVTYMLMDKPTITREYAALEAIPDNYPKIIVSLDEVQLPSRNGIGHIRAWELEDKLERAALR